MNAFTLTNRLAARFVAVLAVFSLLMSMMPMQAFAAVGSITINAGLTGTGPYTASGQWSATGNQPCYNNGNGYRYFIDVFEDVNSNGTYDAGTDVVLTTIDPAPCNGGSYSGVPADNNASNVTWPANGQDGSFGLTDGTHKICSMLQHVNGNGADIVDTDCIPGPVVIGDPETDLEITKSASSLTPAEGASIIYFLTVKNNGTSAATGVVVTDTLPAGVTYQSADVSLENTSPITWNVGNLAVDESKTAEITVLVGADQGGNTIENTATVVGVEQDPNSSNNTSSVTVNPTDVVVDVLGCTDLNANNPTQDATVDDGSCLYDLTVVKSVIGEDMPDYSAFSFKIDGGDTIVFDAGNTKVVEVNKNTHSVVENAATGYDTTYTGGETGTCNNIVVTGNDAVCTITNTVQGTPTGTLNVEKIIAVNGPTDDVTTFKYTLNGGAETTFEVGGTNHVLAAGAAYTVVEVPATGYNTELSAGCSGAIVENQTSTCTITNTWIPTCTDGILNQNETTVDAGGVCGTTPDPVYGCTDDTATNFNPNADTDDQSCEYNYVSQCVAVGEAPIENLLLNGSFETPVVTANGGTWEIFSSVANWTIGLSDGLELWKGLGIGASDGLQHAELDGNDATKITQDVATTPGATYELRFDFAARTADKADNNINALVDGVVVKNANSANTNWTTYGTTFVAANASTEIGLEDIGTPQDNGGTGSLLDNAVLCLVEEPEIVVPSCELTASDNNIRRGQEITLSWNIVGEFVTAMLTNNQNDEDYGTEDAEGSRNADGIRRDTTYTMTVFGDFISESEDREVLGTCDVNIDVRSSGGSSSGTRVTRDGSVAGDSISTPTPQVLGEQVSIVPLGAADAGGGGAAHTSIPAFGLAAMAFVGRTRNNA